MTDCIGIRNVRQLYVYSIILIMILYSSNECCTLMLIIYVMYYYKFVLLKTEWPTFRVILDEVCAVSVKLRLTRRIAVSTCHISSTDLYLRSTLSGRVISVLSRTASQFTYTELSANTSYSIHINFRLNTPYYHRMVLSHVTTRASLGKFPKYNIRQCMYVHVHTYVCMYV